MEKKTNVTIRQTQSSDYSEVYQLIKTAFVTAEYKDGNEQDFAVNLRNSPNYIRELDLLAETKGKAVGHIMLTKTRIIRPDGGVHLTLLVAPVSVLLEFRNQHIASSLMQEGLQIAKDMGYDAAFLLGDPVFYGKLGFKPAQLYHISHLTYPQEYIMAYEIIPDSLKQMSGTIEM